MPFAPQRRTVPHAPPMARKVKIKLGGLEFEPHQSGALYVPDLKTMLVADLHLEQGTSLARRGIHAPPFDTLSTLHALDYVITEYQPETLIFLGDSFHDRIAHVQLPDGHRAHLANMTSKIHTIWISGNHDPDAPTGLGGHSLEACQLGPVTLRHEPSRKRLKACEIAGHLHPGATIIQRGVAVRGKCFVADANRIIMPAFGSYTGALSVSSPAFTRLFDEDSAMIWLIGKSAIHAFPMQRVV